MIIDLVMSSRWACDLNEIIIPTVSPAPSTSDPTIH